MIKHVVLLKLKEYPETEKQEILAKLQSSLDGLTGKIKELKSMEVGLNYEQPAKSYDLCLVSCFENLADLDIYRVHPEHLKVLEQINASAEARAAVDYEG